MRVYTRAEVPLVADLGVYGIWLLKHGRRLPWFAPCVQDMKAAYQAYWEHRHGDPGGQIKPTGSVAPAILLFRAVDRVVSELLWEGVSKNYEDACIDYIHEGYGRPQQPQTPAMADDNPDVGGLLATGPRVSGHNDKWLAELRLRVPVILFMQACRIYNAEDKTAAAAFIRKHQPTLVMEGLPPAEEAEDIPTIPHQHTGGATDS